MSSSWKNSGCILRKVILHSASNSLEKSVAWSDLAEVTSTSRSGRMILQMPWTQCSDAVSSCNCGARWWSCFCTYFWGNIHDSVEFGYIAFKSSDSAHNNINIVSSLFHHVIRRHHLGIAIWDVKSWLSYRSRVFRLDTPYVITVWTESNHLVWCS